MQKYKVFLNEKRIVFASDRKITLSKPSGALTETSSAEEVLKWLYGFIQSDEMEGVLEHPNPQMLFQTFKSALTVVEAAGGVVLRKGRILFIHRNGKWDLPKGKIDPGESSKKAALREVEEECGICGHRITGQLPSTFHIYPSPYPESKGDWIFKETFWYEMEYSGSADGTPQLDEGISEVRWFERDNLDEVLTNTYANLRQIINLFN